MDDIISSRQNPRVKKLCALSDKKEREAQRAFRFDGIKLFEEAIFCGVYIENVFLREDLSKNMPQRLKKSLDMLSHDKIIYLSESLFDRISEEKSSEGIITVAKYIDKFDKIIKIDKEEFSLPYGGVIILESLRDTGNVGTVIRTAASLGIGRVVLSSDCADIYNPKTIRAAMGAIFKTDILRVETGLIPEYIRMIREHGAKVYAAALDAKAVSLDALRVEKNVCFAIGNEGHGLSADTVSACDGSVIIPMSDGCESLNAAAASTILIWEMRRARGKKS